jgi:WD40 repeat protein
MDSYKRYNVRLLDESTLIFIAGASYQIYNYETKEKKIFFSKDGGGIGSISVHPSHKFFAVAEKGTNPNIYIYSYPDLKLYRILRKGTERSYSNLSFSQNGKMLASVFIYKKYDLFI